MRVGAGVVAAGPNARVAIKLEISFASHCFITVSVVFAGGAVGALPEKLVYHCTACAGEDC